MRGALLLLAVGGCDGYVPPAQHRHEQLTAMEAAFSRFSTEGVSGSVDRQDLPNFLRNVIASMSSPGITQDELIARSTRLTTQLMEKLPAEKSRFDLQDILQATEHVIVQPQPTEEEESVERGRLGARAWLRS